MNLYNFLNKWYSAKSKTEYRTKQIVTNIFLPFLAMLEIIAYRYYWHKIIVGELLRNDEIVFFLERNDFKFIGNKFIKFETIQPDSYYDQKPIREGTEELRLEFASAIATLIQKQTPIGIEDNISIKCYIERRSVQHLGEYIHSKMYFIEIFFDRYRRMIDTLYNCIWWLVIVLCLVAIPTLYNYYHGI